METVLEHLRKCVRSKLTNEDALPDDLKNESIFFSSGTADINNITFGSTEPASRPGKNIPTQIAQKFHRDWLIGD